MPSLQTRGPRLAAWTLGALTAVALAGSVYRMPIQVSDSLEVIQRVIPMPSATAAFVDGLYNSPTMLRPGSTQISGSGYSACEKFVLIASVIAPTYSLIGSGVSPST